MAKKRFFKSNLSTIVWDAEKDRELANFSKGHFTTDDPKVQKKLIEMGYPEIPLNATTPPAIYISEPSMVVEGDVPVIAAGTAPIVAQKRMEAITHEVGGPEKPIEKKTTATPKTVKKKAPLKKNVKAKTSKGSPKLKRLTKKEK